MLPPPLTAEPGSVLGQLLGGPALEMDALKEDLDRLRRTHWVEFVYRLQDLEKLAALVGVSRLAWEDLDSFLSRLIATVRARLRGALDVGSLRQFAYEYLRDAERVLDVTLVPGLQRRGQEAAFDEDPEDPLFRPLELSENPRVRSRSGALAALSGRVPYLFQWDEENCGLDETVAAFTVTGLPGGRTAVPLLANTTTGDLVGYADVLGVGRRLSIEAAPDGDGREARALLDGADVTDRLFSVSGFRMGEPFEPEDLAAHPLLPRMRRGSNRWVFLSVGRFDVRGLDRVFYAIADDRLREGVFDETAFDHALFPQGPVANLAMEWTEVERAAFEVRVPGGVTIEPADAPVRRADVDDALGSTVRELHAAGVRAEVRTVPFAESQDQRVRVRLPWLVLPPEAGPSGAVRDLSLGGHFGRTGLDESRFE